MTDRIITAHQGRSTWQGHTSDAPEWVLRAVAAVAGEEIDGEAAKLPAVGPCDGFRHIAAQDTETASGGQEIGACVDGVKA